IVDFTCFHLLNAFSFVSLLCSINGIQIGVGLMVFQQFFGYNRVVFRANQIFTSARVPPNVGSIFYACFFDPSDN
ncbi:hypothetical protein ES332_D13G236800v1, partial [Gossypium tomentosum]